MVQSEAAKKGGFLTWKPRVIVFTSNFPPEQWWNISPTDKSYLAFMRRVTDITEVVYKEPEPHGRQEETSDEEELQWPPCEEEYIDYGEKDEEDSGASDSEEH
jgi:hypothetical protein